MRAAWDRTRPESARKEDWDAALRLSDRVSDALFADREMAVFGWLAVRFSDGDGDGAIYPTRDHAVAHQLAPEHMSFLQITPDGMSPRAAWRYLRITRDMKSRWRADFHDPHAFPIIPARIELARGVLL